MGGLTAYSCFAKGCPKKEKNDATIPKGSMGRSEISVHMLNIHTIKKKMNNDFQTVSGMS